MEQETVSIIIPVYNAEAYLDRCLAGVTGQTYQNLEVILVDDGSYDSSFKICQKYQDRDRRIQLIKKKNEGVSKARNIGIQMSSGKYLLFVDADDEIDKTYVEVLAKHMKDNELAICAYARQGKERKSIVYQQDGAVSRETLFLHTFCSNLIGGACWNKMFSAELIRRYKLQFEVSISMGEDMLFLGEYYRVCKKVIYLPECLYCYKRNADSVMQQSYQKKRFDSQKASCLYAVSKLSELYRNDTENIRSCIAYRTVRTSLWLLYQMICCRYYEKGLLLSIQKLIRHNYFRYRRNNYATFLEKMTAAGMCIIPKGVYGIGITVMPIMGKKLEKYLS